MKKSSLWFSIVLLVLATLACNFSLSSASVAEAKLARDPDGNQVTTVFNQDDPFYFLVELANAPDDTTAKAVWTVVEADGTGPDFLLGEKELTGSGPLEFSLTNEDLWPTGNYKVDLYLNGELERTVEFQVEGEVAVAEEPTDTPEPEPTDTPEPEPTATPEPTEEPTESAAGDTLSLEATEEATTEPTAEAAAAVEPLPFQPEPYVHPSGAFTFAVPEGWELSSESETEATFGDADSAVGTVFVDAGVVFSEEEMQSFMDSFLESFMASFSDSYEILVQETQPDDSIYVGTIYESSTGPGDADFFFEQRETVVFVLYFVTTRYEELGATWDEIIASYAVDAEAALAAAPAATAAPATPTEAPPPPPPPTPNPGPGCEPLCPPTRSSQVVCV